MKKLLLFILFVAVMACLSPFAMASYTLDKPSAGQVIFLEADNDLDYKADFPLSALTGAFREGDDLRLEFPAARLTLKGFFAPFGEWRGLYFSDGGSIGGADFDENGQCTVKFHNVLSREKKADEAKLGANMSGQGSFFVQVRLSPYGNKATLNGEDVFGELLNSCLAAVYGIFPAEGLDWSVYEELRFELMMHTDGSFTPLRAYADFTNGLRSATVNPQRVYPTADFGFVPVSVGRAQVSFSSSRGENLTDVQLRCYKDDKGELVAGFECSNCGKLQCGQLHYLPCGHYSCSDGFDESAHSLPKCELMGHCISENEHEKCSNCLDFTCIGEAHGYGYCEHTHNWVALSLVSSRCASCGYVYTRS